jgi:toxin HigB-1
VNQWFADADWRAGTSHFLQCRSRGANQISGFRLETPSGSGSTLAVSLPTPSETGSSQSRAPLVPTIPPIALYVIPETLYTGFGNFRQANQLIHSFKCAETQKLFEGIISKKVAADCSRVAQRKLQMLHAAARIEDLEVPPGNKLEALKGDRKGQYSIRINERWRVCFVWDGEANSANAVEIVDYH